MIHPRLVVAAMMAIQNNQDGPDPDLTASLDHNREVTSGSAYSGITYSNYDSNCTNYYPEPEPVRAPFEPSEHLYQLPVNKTPLVAHPARLNRRSEPRWGAKRRHSKTYRGRQ